MVYCVTGPQIERIPDLRVYSVLRVCLRVCVYFCVCHTETKRVSSTSNFTDHKDVTATLIAAEEGVRARAHTHTDTHAHLLT